MADGLLVEDAEPKKFFQNLKEERTRVYLKFFKLTIAYLAFG